MQRDRRERGEGEERKGECKKEREAEWEASVSLLVLPKQQGEEERGGSAGVCERLVAAAKRSPAAVYFGLQERMDAHTHTCRT